MRASSECDAWTVRLTREARRSLDALPDKVRPAVIAFLTNSLTSDPYRVGPRLERELVGLHSARRGEYRVIYEVRPETREVIVLRTQHRRDAYRPR